MAFLLQPDIVRYSCTCGTLNPISKIYFCRHCLKIRCGYCVCHEVDSNYCANCLENLPSLEARLQKHRCATCYDCPSCYHSLSIRATSVSSPNPEDSAKVVTRKFYYLACSFCRWTTRDSGIPDQTAASGGWPENTNPNTARIDELLEYYKVVAMQERYDKEQKKNPRSNHRHRPSPNTLDSKYGMTAAMARKRAGLPAISVATIKEMGIFPDMAPAKAVEEVEGLPADIFEKAPDLMSITTLSQRFAEPDQQVALVSQLIPSHKRLFIKQSLRCRTCEHNVSKPEYNPASTKFKIQLSAYYHVPEVRIFTCEPLRLGSASELILKLCNPTQHMTSIQLLPLEQEADIDHQAGGDADVSKLSLSDGVSHGVKVTGLAELPACEVMLPQRDDAAEYDDSGETHNFHDDPKVVVWRKGNKVMVKMAVKPQDSPSKDVVIGFILKYAYTNTMTTLGLEQKEKQKVDLQVPVYVKIGKILGSG